VWSRGVACWGASHHASRLDQSTDVPNHPVATSPTAPQASGALCRSTVPTTSAAPAAATPTAPTAAVAPDASTGTVTHRVDCARCFRWFCRGHRPTVPTPRTRCRCEEGAGAPRFRFGKLRSSSQPQRLHGPNVWAPSEVRAFVPTATSSTCVLPTAAALTPFDRAPFVMRDCAWVAAAAPAVPCLHASGGGGYPVFACGGRGVGDDGQ